MAELKIVATIVVKEAHKVELTKVFHAVVDGTRKESGNISYDLHVDVNNPLKFTLLEVWKDQQAIDLHNASDHFAAFKRGIAGKIESLAVDIIKQVY
ncbi:putative quinol monooxygenase [Dysgonomonas sp. ZJ279]|uniref:putative quinol monooxygenase n=1 Tax=Dysgonomonas sp. ZJ279 TaxID=2709796 RepID=UPI0013EB61E7|nr:putative quinol monooxygenase [Dysgonomonas sp. ZJ279]